MSSDPEHVKVVVAASRALTETNVTKTTRHTTYPAISPTRPALSQAGKTVLVTGGGTNIGLEISKSFVQASAAKVIIVGRRAEILAASAEELTTLANEKRTGTQIVCRTCDLKSVDAINALWDGFKSEGTAVDVLVSNASKFSEEVNELLQLGAEYIWSLFETNVRAPLFLIERFYKQNEDAQKFFVNITSQAANYWWSPIVTGRRSYGMTKASAASALQSIATEVSPEKLQIVTFHPGTVWTENWGVPKETIPFDDISLCSSFAVWAASPEARFMHGRFAWAAWDVEELATGEVRKRIDEDPEFLAFSVVGLKLGNLA